MCVGPVDISTGLFSFPAGIYDYYLKAFYGNVLID